MGVTIKDEGFCQGSIFDGVKPLKIIKPLRLIELFAGIGAQAKALENLGVQFEHYRICEFDKYAVTSYNAVHGTNFSTSDITEIHAEDLGIIETDKYEYIMTYSFPCTDLSKAGKQQGMSRERGTRSGLLWEVERLLKETKQLPQILLMENVPDVLSQKNSKDFYFWCNFLEKLGYTNKYALLNSKDFGVPQNRERCFMLSWLGEDYYYDFPNKVPLSIRLKDILEKKVDEKYYLSEKTIKYFIKHTQESIEKGNGFRFEPTDGNVIGKTIRTKAGSRIDDNFIRCEHIAQLEGGFEPIVWDGFNQSIRKDSSCVGTLTRNCGADLKRNGQGIVENCDLRLFQYGHGYLPPGEINSDVFPTVRESNTARYNNAILQNGDVRVRKLTPKECWRLMGFGDESFYKAAFGKNVPTELAKRVEFRNLTRKEWGKLWVYMRCQQVSNSQLYKQAGNSIVVDVLMAIFKKLF